MERNLHHLDISDKALASRKRYLFATLVTCISLAIIGGSLHVLELGKKRMNDMRSMAAYDLDEMHEHIRAAGEDITLHEVNEAGLTESRPYTVSEVEKLVSAETWKMLDEMIDIPAGRFTMGTDRSRADEQDKPAHEVTLPAYSIDKYPVTNVQYARFVAQTGYRNPLHWENGRIPAGLNLHPVTLVSWYDAQAYCEHFGKRLPTEAEWEKAARGTTHNRWPWGNFMDAERLNTYYAIGATTPVNRFPEGASPYGVMDMAGNVSEWTADDFLPYRGSHAPSDLFDAKIAKAVTAEDRAKKVVDLVPTGKRYKVMRGGSWKSDPFSTTTYHRNFAWSNSASDFFGFRCAKDTNDQGGQ
ncbi:MAG: formylglycine-generating enzyme family protein [Gammaproteobacteria bacterium]|nr:MAG: formylglycine-generating enzyme family protein [Gammaproteobacteria bacterium]